MAQNAFDSGGRKVDPRFSQRVKRSKTSQFGGTLADSPYQRDPWLDQLSRATKKLKSIQTPKTPPSMASAVRKRTTGFVPTVRLDASQITDRRRPPMASPSHPRPGGRVR